MELELLISIVPLCGFAAALSYNVYEFRKVGTRLNKMTGEMSKEHREMVRALDRISESLAGLAKSFGSKGRKTK